MTLIGQVRAIRGSWLEVAHEGRLYRCTVRKKLKRRPREGGKVACVGDFVELAPQPDGEGVIESFLPRRNRLSRRDPYRPDREQVIVANIDMLIAVQAVAEPRFDPRTMDRMTVLGEAAGLPVAVCINKSDLGKPDDWVAVYRAAGYPTPTTSARNGGGLTELGAMIAGRTCVLLGPSGVGKSSLVNALEPSLALKTSEVSHKTGEGRHTTTWVELLPVAGGAVVDTPGLEFFTLWSVHAGNLHELFPEFVARAPGCRFRDCRHVAEPRCAVRAAVEAGDLAPSRYDSYLDMRRELGIA